LGAEKIDREVSKFEKCFFGFFEKGPPGQKSIIMVFLGIKDPNGLPKEFSAIFGMRGRKVCTC